MCPLEAKVILIEDDPFIRRSVRTALEGDGHEIVAEESSYVGACDLIKRLAEEENSIGVAILDGRLSRSSEEGEDGLLLAAEIRRKLPGVKIVGYSGGKEFRGTDAWVSKRDSCGQLLRAVREI